MEWITLQVLIDLLWHSSAEDKHTPTQSVEETHSEAISSRVWDSKDGWPKWTYKVVNIKDKMSVRCSDTYFLYLQHESDTNCSKVHTGFSAFILDSFQELWSIELLDRRAGDQVEVHYNNHNSPTHLFSFKLTELKVTGSLNETSTASHQ